MNKEFFSVVALHIGKNIVIKEIRNFFNCQLIKREASFLLYEASDNAYVYIKDYGSIVFYNCKNEIINQFLTKISENENYELEYFNREEYQVYKSENLEVDFNAVYLNNFDIVDENEVDYNEEIKLVSTGVARPNSKSSQDNEDIVIRYRYVGNPNPQRDFCKVMMKANKIYRKEDIEQLSNKVVNAGWGPNGVDKYSIWLYKGGGNCHHKWNRVIYLRKGKTVDVNSPLAEVISTSKARRKGYKVETNDTKVSVEPRNMTNKGFLNPR